MNIRTAILDLLAPAPADGRPRVPGITFYGDSIGFSLDLHERFKTLMPGAMVVDRSMPGDTAEQAWRRFPYDVRSTQVVLLQVGTNDLGQGNDPVPALRKMAEYAYAEGRTPIFTGITWRTGVGIIPVADTNRRIEELAFEFQTLFVGWNHIPLVAADGLHPDEPMRTTMAEWLANSLKGRL